MVFDSDFDLTKANSYLVSINTDGDEKITQEELNDAKNKVPSLFLEKIKNLANGQDITVDDVVKGLGIESQETYNTSSTTPFVVENYFDYHEKRTDINRPESYDDIENPFPWVKDARGCDISHLDISKEQLLDLTIDNTTILSDEQRAIIADATERMKDPGLNIRALHQRGITGAGVKIAIIDQPLGLHQEYKDNIIHHESINCEEMGWTYGSMHGASVASIAVGKEVGVAPDADLLYFSAVNMTKDKNELQTYKQYILEQLSSDQCPENLKDYYNQLLSWMDEEGQCISNTAYAQAIEKVLDMNKTLPDGEKIPVISISWGFAPDAPGWEQLQEVLKRAKEEGVFVISTSLEMTHDFYNNGTDRNPSLDPNDPTSYEGGCFWKDDEDRLYHMLENCDNILLTPMDHRATADFLDDHSYRYEGSDGAMSWATPWLSGMYVLAKQVKPDVTPEEFWQKALETANDCLNKGEKVGRLINPEALIQALQEE